MQTTVIPQLVELTRFRLQPDAQEAAFVEAANAMQKGFLDLQPGFISRNLVVDSAGNWTDVVYWESEAAIHAAMQKAEAAPEAAAFMQMIDFQTVQMQLNRPTLVATK